MAEYLYQVEGIYETDKGNGKDYTPFNFEIKLSRFYPEGAGSHILRRFLPILIRKQKNKPLLSGIRSWLITDTKKVSDDFPLEGKEISQMTEQEIQELACMYDIFEIPLPNTMSITELRLKAMEGYMKSVLKIPMKTPEEQARLGFFKRQADGTMKLDLGNEKLVVKVYDSYFQKRQQIKKKSLSDFIQNEDKQVSSGILSVNTKFEDAQNDAKENTENNDREDGFPTLNDLGIENIPQ